MSMIFDLHVHSDFSDSSRTVEEALYEAKKKKIELLSFVDHDTTETYPYAKDLARKFGITLIPGIEISAYDFSRKRKVHILGYKYSLKASHIKALVTPLLKRRDENSRKQLELIRGASYEVPEEKLRTSRNSLKTLYKQHIVFAMTQMPYTSSIYQLTYRKLFKDGGIAQRDIEYLDVFDAIQAIKKDDGVAVLAHPGQLNSYDLLPELLEVGLDGIEVYHPSHTKEDENRSRNLADKYGLGIFGGSDDHGIFGEDFMQGNLLLEKKTRDLLDIDNFTHIL